MPRSLLLYNLIYHVIQWVSKFTSCLFTHLGSNLSLLRPSILHATSSNKIKPTFINETKKKYSWPIFIPFAFRFLLGRDFTAEVICRNSDEHILAKFLGYLFYSASCGIKMVNNIGCLNRSIQICNHFMWLLKKQYFHFRIF